MRLIEVVDGCAYHRGVADQGAQLAP